MTLATVADYVTEARTLLQDKVQPFRYPDLDLVDALNMAMLEASKLRPDLLIDLKYQNRVLRVQKTIAPEVAQYLIADATVVQWPSQYKMPVLYYIIGMAQLRDTEDVEDKRAAAFLSKFIAQLLTLGA